MHFRRKNFCYLSLCFPKENTSSCVSGYNWSVGCISCVGRNRPRLHHQRLGNFSFSSFYLHWIFAGAEEGKPVGEGVEGQGGDVEGRLGGDRG